MKTTTKIGAGLAALALGLGIAVVPALSASAHDATIVADCSGASVHLTNYPKGSTIAGTVDGVDLGPFTFGPTYDGHVVWGDGQDHAYDITVVSGDGDHRYDHHWVRQVTGCAPVVTPTPTPTETSTPTPTGTPTTMPSPTDTPTPTDTPSPTTGPTSTPTEAPTSAPSGTPTEHATTPPVTVSTPSASPIATTPATAPVATTTPTATAIPVAQAAQSSLAMTGTEGLPVVVTAGGVLVTIGLAFVVAAIRRRNSA